MTHQMINTISEILFSVESGDVNALTAYVELKKLDEVLSKSLKQLLPEAIDEAAKYPEKTFDVNGASVTKKANAGKWSYEGCPSVIRLDSELKDAQAAAKAAYNAKIKGNIIVDDDGAIIDAASYMPGADSISVSIQGK